MTIPLHQRRRHQLLRSALLVVMAAAPTSGAAHGNPASDRAQRIERWLAQPASPSVEVLLVEGGGDPRVDAHWSASLAHADPAVRGAAARAIRVAARSHLAPNLETALLNESDPLAASELADALIDISGGVHAVVRDTIRRFPRPLTTTTFLTLLRRAPAALPPLLPDLLAAGEDDERLALGLAELLATRPAEAAVVVDALAHLEAPAARVLLDRAYTAHLHVATADEQLRAALGSRHLAVRELALVELLLRARDAGDKAHGITSAFPHTVADAPPSPRSPGLVMLRELLQRVQRGTADGGESLVGVIAEIDDAAPAARLRRTPLTWWSAAERAALASRWPDVQQDGGAEDTSRVRPPVPPVQGAHDLPAGVLPAVTRGAGCPGRASGLAFGTVEYDARGRPRIIQVPPAFSERCRHAVATILRLGTAMGPTTRTSVVPLQGAPTFGTRVALPVATMKTLELRPGAEGPRVRKQVVPSYSPDALAERVEGRVWLTVTIDERGAVREVDVSRALHPSLNREAIVAMSRWQFHPATQGGRPVPVRAVVEMEFALRK